MTSLMRPGLHAAAGNSASFPNRLDSTYKSGNVVQTSGATSRYEPYATTIHDFLQSAV